MTLPKPVVIDTNIFFSSMLRNSSIFTKTLFGSENSFHICESVIVELFKHKEKIILSSKLSENDVIRLFYTTLKHVTISREELIDQSIRRRAFELCRDIDESDSPHVALTLKLDGLLWT